MSEFSHSEKISLGQKFGDAIIHSVIEAKPVSAKIEKILEEEFGEKHTKFHLRAEDGCIIVEIPRISSDPLNRTWRFKIIG
jgi:hypothetical protein